MKRFQIYNKDTMKWRRQQLRSVQTKEENILWEFLRNKKLGVKFYRQYSVMNYVLDFCCPVRKVGIEIDGASHTTRKEYDTYRTEYLAAIGVNIIRFTNDDIDKNVLKVVDSIKACLQASLPLVKGRE